MAPIIEGFAVRNAPFSCAFFKFIEISTGSNDVFFGIVFTGHNMVGEKIGFSRSLVSINHNVDIGNEMLRPFIIAELADNPVAKFRSSTDKQAMIICGIRVKTGGQQSFIRPVQPSCQSVNDRRDFVRRDHVPHVLNFLWCQLLGHSFSLSHYQIRELFRAHRNCNDGVTLIRLAMNALVDPLKASGLPQAGRVDSFVALCSFIAKDVNRLENHLGRLSGKSAVVLGASSNKGIGEAIARIFASEGAKVTVSGRKQAPLDALAKDISGTACVCDIGNESQIEALFAHAHNTFGSVDIAVNAAGVNMPGPIEGLTRESLQSLCDVQFIGPALFIKQAAAVMEKNSPNSGGTIMSLSSVTAELTGAGLGAYAATKAAVDKLVKVAAVEYGPRNIRVNSISPGVTPTPMTEKIFDTPSMVKAFKGETPIGRLATPEDVAYAALYLADDRCMATGDNIRVSGGIHLRRLPTYPELMGS